MAIKARQRYGMTEYYDDDTAYKRTVNVDAYQVYKLQADAVGGWVFAAVNSGALTNVAGVFTLTTGAADDDDADLAGPLNMKANQYATIEARIAHGDADKTAFNFGFSDATGEAADTIAFTFATATLTTTASDAALFFSDADATSNVIRYAGVKANTDTAVGSTGTEPADATYHTYRVELDANGAAAFYFDGALQATVAAAVTATTALCPYIAVINHGEAAANTLLVDYCLAWQRKPA